MLRDSSSFVQVGFGPKVNFCPSVIFVPAGLVLASFCASGVTPNGIFPSGILCPIGISFLKGFCPSGILCPIGISFLKGFCPSGILCPIGISFLKGFCPSGFFVTVGSGSNKFCVSRMFYTHSNVTDVGKINNHSLNRIN